MLQRGGDGEEEVGEAGLRGFEALRLAFLVLVAAWASAESRCTVCISIPSQEFAVYGSGYVDWVCPGVGEGPAPSSGRLLAIGPQPF